MFYHLLKYIIIIFKNMSRILTIALLIIIIIIMMMMMMMMMIILLCSFVIFLDI